jgi:L-ascorbate metabolism protein UlaG (beta-lactamase superfamily)
MHLVLGISLELGVLDLELFLLEVLVLKPAALKDEALLADVRATKSDASGFHLWWLGQSGFLIQWQGKHLLFDPYLSDSLTKKYAATDKPHTRMTELVITPEKLDFVGVVTSSHNHTDHLDPETLLPLVKVNVGMLMVCPEANRVTVRERSALPEERIKGLDAGQSVSVSGFEFHAIAAAHEKLDKDKDGRHIYLGFVVKFGPWTIYHSGDTMLFDGMADILKPFKVDVALLPINGRAPERRVAGNLWGREAAQLAKDIGARVVIPCHYDLFTFNTATTEEFERTCVEIGQEYKVMRNGERWDFNRR